MKATSLGGRRALAACLSAVIWLSIDVAHTSAQIVGEAERNVSEMEDFQNECAIAINPSNRNELFVACNKSGPGLFFARSIDRGHSWIYPDADKAIADGDPGQGPLACCDPSVAWDSFGNLYVTYLANVSDIEDDVTGVVTLISTDGGQTFEILTEFAGSADQPTVVAENTTAAGAPVAVWIVWYLPHRMRAMGAAVNGLGRTMIGPFPYTPQSVPGTNSCSFGDVTIAPDGTVVQACQVPKAGEGPGHIMINIDPDGVGALPFGPAVVATPTNVGGIDFIPPQDSHGVDAEAGLAYDRNPASPHFGRLYLVYTDEVADEGNDTDIMLLYSDNNGETWNSTPIRVNDDPSSPVRSQFLPRIATNPLSGNILVCWHDARNSGSNTEMQEFCSASTPTSSVPSFFPNKQVGAGTSSGTGSSAAGKHDIQYGDYSGLDYLQGRAHPVWADQSNITGDNPDGTLTWEAETNRVGGGPMASEGDPHITTVDGIHYDFQASGEFIAARAADGFEVQVRQTAIPTSSFPGQNPHTGLATCVSINSAVAARVGKHRVTWQPSLVGSANPSGMELRIDGVPTPLIDDGVALSGGGRVLRSAVGGMEVEFPNGGLLTATPGFWPSQGKWYLNLNLSETDAYEGIMGALPANSWLPTLPDGSSLSARPASLSQRYDVLYREFAQAWRVSEANSLFDRGQPSPEFASATWPKASPPCDVPDQKSGGPAHESISRDVCRGLADDERRQNCIFDVGVTGETGFAETYLRTERLERWGTTTILAAESKPEQSGGTIQRFFVAAPMPRWLPSKETPTGTVQFYVRGEPAGEPVALDDTGRATWVPKDFDWQNYEVSARYIPAKESAFLTSINETANSPK
ncbi:hypothetical protein RFM99_14655 [Mesorhizobium sp. VK4C]|uniref:hypothetical protein n=1 Tax=Mesorhizobium captivum TaxID=3072319 RepID=UPI002A23F923|nr:hypothetical protein [Mesorhizobium sp. VK4C]MDX8499659.1 hypothetical protein [Mesorhizobium sp. VK4C]